MKPEKAKTLVERHRVRLRIDDDADAADLIGHAAREHEHGAHELAAETSSLGAFVDGEASEAQHGKRIQRQLLRLDDGRSATMISEGVIVANPTMTSPSTATYVVPM